MASRNTLTSALPYTCYVSGTVTGDSTTPTLSNLSGISSSDDDCVSVSRTGAGDYNISVTNFRGPQNQITGYGTATTESNMVACTSQSFTASTDTAVFTFKVEADESTAVDNGFNFILLGY
jgi:hypothetical protein